MRQRLAALRNRVGRRGLFLAFLAVLDVVYGYFILNPPAGILPQHYPVFPAVVWGIAWLVTAAACVTGIFIRHDRIPYTLAALIKMAWALRYAYLWYLGTSFAWVSMTIWLCFASAVVVIASWPEEIITLYPGKKA